MSVIIEMKDASFFAQNRLIVKNFSFEFEEGKTTAIVGASGSGKSTILKLSAGLLVPTTGTVSYKSTDIHLMNRQENLNFRREASVVFQNAALWANMSLFQTLELPLRIHFPEMNIQERKKRISEVLKKVGYKRELMIRPAELSMGEQKLIAFARAIICRPNLLFLDEWTESLDDSSAQRLIALVREQQKEEKTIIFVNHNFRIVKALADYIVMIVDGELSLKVSREQIEKNADLAHYVETGIKSDEEN